MNKKNNLFIGIIIVFILIIGILIINTINTKGNEGNLLKITHKEISQKLKNKEDFILIISRSNCSHCISYKPKVKQIAKDYKITVYYIDYDEEKKPETLLNELNLDGSTPITLFIKNGKETSVLKRLEGDLSKEKIIKKFKEMGFIN